MRHSVLVFIFFTQSSAFAQSPFSVGVIGGGSVTGDFQNQSIELSNGNSLLAYSTPKHWIAGGAAKVRLPFHLLFEVDALYHELEFTQAGYEKSTGALNSVSPAPVVTWEFPLLVEYRFAFRVVKPFVGAGPAFRSAGNLNGTTPSNHAYAATLGAEVRAWKLKIAPQVRYLRWAHDQRVFYTAASTVPNQVEFLTAITF
jgi:hypothetical protein